MLQQPRAVIEYNLPSPKPDGTYDMVLNVIFFWALVPGTKYVLKTTQDGVTFTEASTFTASEATPYRIENYAIGKGRMPVLFTV